MLILAFLIGWNLFREKDLTISPETTFVTQPLASDGKRIDYVEWLRLNQPIEMKTDENGARIIVRELRPDIEHKINVHTKDADVQHAWRVKAGIYSDLGLDPMVSPTARLSDFYAEYYARLAEKYPKGENGSIPPEYDEQKEKFQSAIESEQVHFDEDFTRDWVARNNKALDIIAAASKAKIYKPPFFDNPDWEGPHVLSLLLPGAQETRQYARGLAFRAAWRIAQGDMDGAIDDILTCRRLGQKLGENADFLVEQLVGIAIVGVAARMAPGENPEIEPTREQWQRIYDELTLSPARFNFYETANKSERMTALDYISNMCVSSRRERARLLRNVTPNGTEEENFIEIVLMSLGYDWNTVLREYNRLLDLSLEGKAEEDFSIFPLIHDDESSLEFIKRGVSILLHCSTLQARSKYFGQILANRFLISFDTALEANRRMICAEQLQRIAVAMRLYACDHDGHLPPAYTIDSEGKPLHSWRVLLLPYLGYDLLYQRIHLDEPWNSPHNAQFAAENLPIYRCPSMVKAGWLADGDSSYSVIVGENTFFSAAGAENGIKPAGLSQSAANMFTVVERRDGINWMKPDAELTEEAVLLGSKPSDDPDCPMCLQSDREVSPCPEVMGSAHPNGMNIASYGGSVRLISNFAEELLYPGITGRKPPEEKPDTSDSPSSESK